jgi:nucleoside-diphosphate-sugar epimerase
VNVAGTRLAVEAAARRGARLVHISSVAVYGRRPAVASGERVAEDAPFLPIAAADFYARSKRLAEETLWETARHSGVSAVALRPCVIYGERERIFMGRVLRAVRLGVVPLVGPGDNELALVYAGNVADAVLAALDRPHVEGPFNTTNDGRITQRQVFETIGEVLGRRLRFVRLPLGAAVAANHAWHLVRRLRRPGRYAGLGGSGARFLARENPYTSARAQQELDWRPVTPPRETLRRTVEWFLREGGTS